MTLSDSDIQRFWSKVDRGAPDECWPWLGYVEFGYGRFWLSDGHVQAHRVAYVLTHGPIPAGLQVDHVLARGCVRKDCVNPHHLEAVTPQENTLRFPGHGRIGAAKRERTHCPQGHPYSGDNLYVFPSGGRACRACMRDARHRYRDRLAAR